MKIISWNVNGLRALHRKGNFSWIVNESPDIFCFQEVKAHPDQLVDEIRKSEGYYAYFAFSKVKKGYSGVAVYTKKEPKKVEYGMGIKEFDEEGRLLGVYFDNFVYSMFISQMAAAGRCVSTTNLGFMMLFYRILKKLKRIQREYYFLRRCKYCP